MRGGVARSENVSDRKSRNAFSAQIFPAFSMSRSSPHKTQLTLHGFLSQNVTQSFELYV